MRQTRVRRAHACLCKAKKEVQYVGPRTYLQLYLKLLGFEILGPRVVNIHIKGREKGMHFAQVLQLVTSMASISTSSTTACVALVCAALWQPGAGAVALGRPATAFASPMSTGTSMLRRSSVLALQQRATPYARTRGRQMTRLTRQMTEYSGEDESSVFFGSTTLNRRLQVADSSTSLSLCSVIGACSDCIAAFSESWQFDHIVEIFTLTRTHKHARTHTHKHVGV